MTKAEVRKYIKSLIPTDKYIIEELSQNLCSKIEKADFFIKAPLILAYMPLKDEVDLRPLFKKAFLLNKKLALPRIIPGTNLMDFYLTDEKLCVKTGSFEILEPQAEEKNLIRPDDLPDHTLILVPGRAFTEKGCRLGRGKGFYDIWLSKIHSDKKNRLHIAGVCFPQQIVEKLPCDEDDIMMNSMFF